MKIIGENKERLRKLRAKLPYDYAAKVASEMNIERKRVYRVAHGKNVDTKVLTALCKLAINESTEDEPVLNLLERAIAC